LVRREVFNVAKGKQKTRLGLIALDIQGEWNMPLLENAARLSGADLVYASSEEGREPAAGTCSSFAETAASFDTLIACETGKNAKNIFRFQAPRGRIGLVVGNELAGIPGSILRQCHATVVIPMFCGRLSSINVAASAAVGLYVLSRDLGRQGLPVSGKNAFLPDLLVQAPADPAECGSLLRSVAAFGWKRVYLHDPEQAWFTRDKERITLSRAAARRENNSLAVLEAAGLPVRRYTRVIQCSLGRAGVPLSRFRAESLRGALLALGLDSLPQPLETLPRDELHVDFAESGIQPLPRHAASVLLAVLAQHSMVGK
jgi:hypothetical protein